MEKEKLTFGEAIEALKHGKRVSRKGWNGKGMFIFMRQEYVAEAWTTVSWNSLPESVKSWISGNLKPDDRIKFTPYLCMKAADGTIVNGWLASQTDMLSEDWCILD